MFVESGGDNLTAIFSPALADVQMFVIDVAAGDDIPRKGGPGIARADLLVINKTDLAPHVGADVESMLAESRRAPRPAARARDRRCAAPTARRPSPAGCASGSPPSKRTATCTRARKALPITTTLTRTDEAVLAVGKGAVQTLRRSARLAPRVLSRGPVVRAALVPTQAGPLAGDHDRVRLHVGPGATLVLVPIAATVALPGPQRSTLELDATVEAGGRLVLDEPPLIVAGGADVVREMRLTLDPGAVAAVRDVVVLGRAGEGRGRLDSSLRVTLDGRPLLHDALRVEPAAHDDHVALAPGHRVIGTACLLGERAGDPAHDLAGPGTLWRATGPDVPTVEAALQPFSIGTLTMLPHSVHEPS